MNVWKIFSQEWKIERIIKMVKINDGTFSCPEIIRGHKNAKFKVTGLRIIWKWKSGITVSKLESKVKNITFLLLLHMHPLASYFWKYANRQYLRHFYFENSFDLAHFVGLLRNIYKSRRLQKKSTQGFFYFEQKCYYAMERKICSTGNWIPASIFHNSYVSCMAFIEFERV